MNENKLIAEFMGVKFDKGTFYNMGYDVFSNGNLYRSHELKYHSSWDWLMPVVEKINVVTKYDDYNQNRLHIQRVLDDCINENAVGIEEVHKAVVEFINQYNK